MESISSSSSDSDDDSDNIPRKSFHHVLKKSHVPGKYKENREARSKASKGLINDSTSVCGSIVHKLNPTDPEFSSYEIIEKESEDEKLIPLESPKARHISETEAKIVHSAKEDTIAGVGGRYGEKLKYISTETEHEKVDSSESSTDSFIILSHERLNVEECENTNKLADSVAFDANIKHETMMCINEPKAGPFADDTTTDEGKGINVCIPVGSTSVTVPMAHSHPSSHSLLISVNIQLTPSTPTNTTENSNGDELTESKLTDNITSLTSTSGGQPVCEQTICGDIDAAAESNTHNDGGIDAADTPYSDSSKGRATDTTDYHDGETIASDNESDKTTGGDIDELYRRAGSEIRVDIQKQRLTQSDSFVYDQKDRSNQYSRTRRTTDVTTSDDMQIDDDDESFADVPLDLNEDVQPEIYHRVQPQLVLRVQPDTQSNDAGADERANQALMGRREREIKKESKRMIKSWKEVFIGTMVYLKYLGFWHAILVTGVSPISHRFRGIHYAWPGSGVFKIITRRTVQEDDFEANLADGDLWEVLIPETHRVSPEEAVERARAKLGEKKFNMFTRRSNHFVRECIMK